MAHTRNYTTTANISQALYTLENYSALVFFEAKIMPTYFYQYYCNKEIINYFKFIQ